MATNLPDSCLLGIILTISTHSGPQLIYHYPPETYTHATNAAKSKQYEKKKFNYANAESESSEEEFTSGLSDSELSTDYVDYLSDASDCSLESLSQLLREEMSNSSTTTHPNSGLRSRHSQISANKLFQLLNSNNGNNNYENTISNHNGEHSLRESLHSLKTPANVPSITTDFRIDEEYEEMTDKELKHKILDLLDDSVFQQNTYQDPSKIFHFNSEFVAEFCSPPKEMCNTRFELTIEDLCFLGLPIHADNKGRWRKTRKKRHNSKKSARNSESRRSTTGSLSGDIDVEQQGDDERSDNDNSRTDLNDVQESELLDKNDFDSLEKSINMFQVCFIMNPKITEYNTRIDDMYHYVVTRLSLILRYIQAKTRYVTKECVKIMKCRDRIIKHSQFYKSQATSWQKGKYLYERILCESSLARALTKCYNSIVKNEIANLEIDTDKIISLQIPIKREFSILPNVKTDPVLRGSFLSSILNEDFMGSFNTGLAQDTFNPYANQDTLLDYGLLLLDEPGNIIKGLEKASFDNGVTDLLLINLVKELKPTIRLHQYKYLLKELLETNEHTYDDQFYETTLKSLCLHLIYWRHARVILPISSKNVYVVSPLAPISGFSVSDFSKEEYSSTRIKDSISNSPSNSNISLIYQNQKIFNEKFPSLPTLPSFLHLISNQKPKAFGHIIPSNEHKSMYLSALSWLMRYGYLTQLFTFVYIRVDKRIKIAVDEDLERDGIRFSKTHKLDNFIGGTDNDNNSEFEDLGLFEDNDFTIILEPERDTALEKRWLYKCSETLPGDLQSLFRLVVKYFNGQVSMEYVMAKEGISKHEMRRLLQALGKYVVEVKHW